MRHRSSGESDETTRTGREPCGSFVCAGRECLLSCERSTPVLFFRVAPAGGLVVQSRCMFVSIPLCRHHKTGHFQRVSPARSFDLIGSHWLICSLLLHYWFHFSFCISSFDPIPSPEEHFACLSQSCVACVSRSLSFGRAQLTLTVHAQFTSSSQPLSNSFARLHENIIASW